MPDTLQSQESFEPITSQEDLNRILFSHEIGDTVTVTIYRAGKQGVARLTIEEDKNG